MLPHPTIILVASYGMKGICGKYSLPPIPRLPNVELVDYSLKTIILTNALETNQDNACCHLLQAAIPHQL